MLMVLTLIVIERNVVMLSFIKMVVASLSIVMMCLIKLRINMLSVVKPSIAVILSVSKLSVFMVNVIMSS